MNSDRTVYPDEHLIPSVIFTSKSQDPLNTISYLKSMVSNGTISKEQAPDMVVCLDNGIIFHTLHIENSIFCKWVKGGTGEKYIQLKTGNEENTLAMFLLILLCVLPPEPQMTDFIIKEYLKQGMTNFPYHVIEP